jgi:hypothetical protein
MTEKLEIIIHATDQAGKELQNLAGDMTKMGVAATAVGIAVGVAASAMAAFAAIVGKGVLEASEWEQGMAQLDARIKSTAGSAGVNQTAITQLADAMQKNTRYTDDAVLSASNLALTFTNIKSDIFPDVIRLSADMATAMKTDLNSAILQVGKAMQDPIGGATALRRAGVMLTDSQEALIEKLVVAGRGMEAQKIILGELATEFEGSAVAAGGTFAGQLDRIANSGNNLLEKLGKAILPGLEAITGSILKILEDPAVEQGMTNLATSLGESLMPKLIGIAAFIEDDAVPAFQSLGKAADAAGQVISGVLGPIGQFFGWLGKTIEGGISSEMENAFAAYKPATGWLPLELGPGTDLTGAPIGPKESSYARMMAEYRVMHPSAAATSRWAGMNLWGQPQAPSTRTPYNFSMPDAGIDSSFLGQLNAKNEDAKNLLQVIADATDWLRKNPGDKLARGILLDAQKKLASIDSGVAGLGGKDMATSLAQAFPNMGAAQAWQGAFAAQHGGRAPGATDVRDQQASVRFAAKYGRGPTDEEWTKRWEKGSFEGVDESGLDEMFGKPGTWETLVTEQGKEDQKRVGELEQAFARVMKGPIPVTFIAPSMQHGGFTGMGGPVITHPGEVIINPAEPGRARQLLGQAGLGGNVYFTINSSARHEDLMRSVHMARALGRM